MPTAIYLPDADSGDTMPAFLEIDPDRTYPALKNYCRGAIDVVTITFGGQRADLWVNDEGLINGMPLNVPASMLAGMPLFGPVVIAGTDDEGETINAPEALLNYFAHLLTRPDPTFTITTWDPDSEPF
jgi:hypothetical protein